MAAALAVAPPKCPALDRHDQLVQRLVLHTQGRDLTATSYKVPGEGVGGYRATRLLINNYDCDPLYEHEFEGTSEIKLVLVHLASTPLLAVSVLSPGGSGCGLDHAIIDFQSGPYALAPMPLRHDNMGGFFVGDLGHGRGPGLVLLQADWDRGSHYDPHPYRVSVYRWRTGQFVGPSVIRTKPMAPDPMKVARTLGFPVSNEMAFDC